MYTIAPAFVAGSDRGIFDLSGAVDAVSKLQMLPNFLRLLCDATGMGFAVVAQVTETAWTVCAVKDDIALGLQPGQQLETDKTLCAESRKSRRPIVIDSLSLDPVYRDHPIRALLNVESHISVPIVFPDGTYFGSLCAIDRRPANASQPQTLAVFEAFAQIIATHLEAHFVHERDKALLAAAKEANDAREQFIAILGHDLRNPLQSITVTGAILERRFADTPAVAQMGIRIGKSARRMAALIDDVLEFARGRMGGGIDVKLEPVVNLHDALLNVVEEIRDSSPGRQIELSVNVNGPIRCDLRRLQQVASNLIANAIAHGSPDGPVKVSVNASDAELVLEVWNDGKPIPVAMMPKIFEPFRQLEAGSSRHGLGLGLHICSQIVQSYKGEISVTSTREAGTNFCVRIPLAAC